MYTYTRLCYLAGTPRIVSHIKTSIAISQPPYPSITPRYTQ